MNFARAGSTIGRPGARFVHFRRADASGSILPLSCRSATTQPAVKPRFRARRSVQKSLSHRPHGADDASRGGGYEPFFDVRLLVFPEFCHARSTMSLADLREQLAVELPGDSLTPYIKACQELGCFVWTGTFLERDSNYPDAVFNTTCLVGPTGLLAKYRKVNPWVPWEVHASPHDIADYPDDPFSSGGNRNRSTWGRHLLRLAVSRDPARAGFQRS